MKFNFAYTALVTVIMTIISRFDGVAASSAASSSSGLDEIDPPQTRKTRSLTSKKNGSGYGRPQSSLNDDDHCTKPGGDAYKTGSKKKCCDKRKAEWKPCRKPPDQCYICPEGAGPAPSPSPDAPCEVVCGAKQVEFTNETNHTKYACGAPTYDNEHNTWVCYPKEKGPKKHIPVVFYNRDSNGWVKPSPNYPSWINNIDPGNKKWLRTIAEQCLITIAPMTIENQEGDLTRKALCKQNYDSLLVYEFLKYNDGWKKWGITPLVKPDLERIAAAGLSAGGHHIPSFQMLMGNVHNITMKAVLIGHGGSLSKKESAEKNPPWSYKSDMDICLKKGNGKWCNDVPALFLTATDDKTVNYTRTHHWYNRLTGQTSPKSRPRVNNAVYAQAKTGGHLEPTNPALGIFNDYSARFLACYLYKEYVPEVSREACAWIYKSSTDNICTSPEVKALALDKVALFHNGEKISSCD